MFKPVIHVSGSDATSDFASLMARVREGTEVVIERDAMPVAVLHPAGPVRRKIYGCIALARTREEETGDIPVLDADFAADVEEIVKDRKPWIPPAWE
jgi:antitoxin (DNA-binding transcriptional repressor) of toxin-antitoxin stability system